VLTARHREAWLRASVFGVLVGRRFDTMLEETYRMNAELTEWPSRQHYSGQLRCASEEIARRRIIYPRPPVRFETILDPEAPKVFVDLRHRNATTSSMAEASLICDLIAELLACGVKTRRNWRRHAVSGAGAHHSQPAPLYDPRQRTTAEDCC
jgi:DNA replication ATP-dependent helicase Dna2